MRQGTGRWCYLPVRSASEPLRQGSALWLTGVYIFFSFLCDFTGSVLALYYVHAFREVGGADLTSVEVVYLACCVQIVRCKCGDSCRLVVAGEIHLAQVGQIECLAACCEGVAGDVDCE